MANSYFQFKQFTVHQDKCAMKVTTDSCLFGAFLANTISNSEPALSAGGLVINNCLDIGTGTGLLSLMLAQVNNCHIDSIEIDATAAEQARANIAASPFAEKINIIQADVKKYSFEKKYDLIISNPPFYEKELKGENEKKNIAHHSEELSLTVLLTILKDNLSASGKFYLLLPFIRDAEIKNLISSENFQIETITYIRQTVKHDYFRMIVTGKFRTENPEETILEEMAIKDEIRNYTAEFIALLKDYYLHL